MEELDKLVSWRHFFSSKENYAGGRLTQPLEVHQHAEILNAFNEVVVQLQFAQILETAKVVDAKDVWGL